MLDGLIKNEDEITNSINKKSRPKLAPVQEIEEITDKIPPLNKPDLQKQNFKKKTPQNFQLEKKDNFFSRDEITQGNIKNLTTDSFFKPGALKANQMGFKSANKNPISSDKNLIPSPRKEKPPMKPSKTGKSKATPPQIPTATGSGIRIPSGVRLPDEIQESLLVEESKKRAEKVVERIENQTSRTKIKNETLGKDLNCTMDESSIMDVFADENGYLTDANGQLIYDDFGKVIRLTDEQIDNFKENDLYEEIEC